ncbi:DUF4241 domain-containing protein [Jidongwangia harbinensis]|uniref:DUF4241 domain-containing protein n=1 Tax=Jidongwangia harbinensis TaxID=2878561 RepID=UPI001CDA28E0|nr:DUF4241 domain-containing protein [Jidongwangia harbinensis]MCA2219340.1 DUF4241 domain-containing protein [Jidongwangia harbinensis]
MRSWADYDEQFTVDIRGDEKPSASIAHTWLSLPTGRVVAADPLGAGHDDPPAPFVQVVPPGRYRVELLVSNGEVAAARLVVRDEPAASWEPALPEGCPDGTGYEVNAGTGCFTDERTFRHLSGMPGGDWQLTLLDDLSWMRDGPTVIARAEVDGSCGDEGDENVLVAFPSGAGDGIYGTWVGRTAQGEITCFVTDFFPDK